jgi:hypothetical protein
MHVAQMPEHHRPGLQVLRRTHPAESEPETLCGGPQLP